MPPERQHGFSLIELMVAVTLGLLLLAGLGTLFLGTSRSYRENDLIAGMQDQARFAMATLSRDLSMAGYWGGMMGSDGIVPNLANESEDDDLSRATVITMYLLPDVNLKLRPRLQALKPGTRIVSHDWDMGDWKPDRMVTIDVPDKPYGLEKVSRLYLWTVPPR